MRSKISFDEFWAEHKDERIHELEARFIWDAAEAITCGWGLDGKCKSCRRTDRPRKARGLCVCCYQLSRYHATKKIEVK